MRLTSHIHTIKHYSGCEISDTALVDEAGRLGQYSIIIISYVSQLRWQSLAVEYAISCLLCYCVGPGAHTLKFLFFSLHSIFSSPWSISEPGFSSFTLPTTLAACTEMDRSKVKSIRYVLPLQKTTWDMWQFGFLPDFPQHSLSLRFSTCHVSISNDKK